MPIDSSGTAQAPVLIATGRVPVFDAAANASTGPITACPWAPGGAMQAESQARQLCCMIPIQPVDAVRLWLKLSLTSLCLPCPSPYRLHRCSTM